jgi:hypothetical protein
VKIPIFSKIGNLDVGGFVIQLIKKKGLTLLYFCINKKWIDAFPPDIYVLYSRNFTWLGSWLHQLLKEVRKRIRSRSQWELKRIGFLILELHWVSQVPLIGLHLLQLHYRPTFDPSHKLVVNVDHFIHMITGLQQNTCMVVLDVPMIKICICPRPVCWKLGTLVRQIRNLYWGLGPLWRWKLGLMKKSGGTVYHVPYEICT